jgi:hypothetical protein
LKKQIIVSMWLLAFAAICLTQESQSKNNQHVKPNFSGTWELDKTRSTLTPENPVSRGGVIRLAITHDDPQLKITQKTTLDGKDKTREFVYYSDGRGETNHSSSMYLSFYEDVKTPTSTMPRAIESKSKWKERRLRTNYSVIVPIPDGRHAKVKVEEEWELTDEKTLVQTTSIRDADRKFQMHFEPGKLKKVFKRIS